MGLRLGNIFRLGVKELRGGSRPVLLMLFVFTLRVSMSKSNSKLRTSPSASSMRISRNCRVESSARCCLLTLQLLSR
jgi:hypothetical protein